MKVTTNCLLTGLSISLAIFFIAGCGGSNGKMMQVSGTVLLDGKPLPDAKITFMPENGSRPANAVTDGEGNFDNAATFRPGDGVLLGKHWVAITSLKPPPMPGVVDPDAKPTKAGAYRPSIPIVYGMPKESGLTATVSSDSDNKFTFELNSKRKD